MGLEAAVHSVLRSGGGPHAVVVISDFYTADDLETLRRVAVAARRRRHSVVVVCPSDPGFDTDERPVGKLERAILDVERLRTRMNLSVAQAVLKPAGVVFLRCGPRDVVPRLLHRLRQVA